MKKNYSAFTLIELLVVIAIIGLLLAVIVPSLTKAKEAGMNVICQNNLRQFGIALSMYCNNNRGEFANCEDWLYLDFVPSGKYARDLNSPTNFECMWHNSSYYPDGVVMDYLSDKNVQLCPLFRNLSLSRSNCAQGISHNPAIRIDPVFCYSQNVFLGKMEYSPVATTTYAKRITDIKTPSTVFAYSEENPYSIPNYSAASGMGRPTLKNGCNSSYNDCLLYVLDPRTAKTTIDAAGGKYASIDKFDLTDGFASYHRASDKSFRYRGYANAVFIDGHVQPVTVEDSIKYSWPF